MPPKIEHLIRMLRRRGRYLSPAAIVRIGRYAKEEFLLSIAPYECVHRFMSGDASLVVIECFRRGIEFVFEN